MNWKLFVLLKIAIERSIVTSSMKSSSLFVHLYLKKMAAVFVIVLHLQAEKEFKHSKSYILQHTLIACLKHNCGSLFRYE